MTELQRRILAAARKELRRVSAIEVDPWNRVGMDRFKFADLRQAVEDAKGGILPLDWFILLGFTPSDTERRAANRAVVALEAAGKLRRLYLGYDAARATHILLTTRGEGSDG